MTFEFKWVYDNKEAANRAAVLIREQAPKIKEGQSNFITVPVSLGDGKYTVSVTLYASVLRRFEKAFAKDRISILGHSLKHAEARYKKNLRSASEYITSAKFVIRKRAKFKFFVSQSVCADIMSGAEVFQSDCMKLQRQVRLQNKFISAIRKLENASNA